VLVAGLLAGATVCLPGAIGEELAWRGLLRRELAPIGFWPSCLVIGLLWAGWHLPAVILGGYAGGTAAGALALTVKLLIVTPLAMVLCQRGRSVMAAALFHSSGSGMVAASMMVKGGQGLLPALAPYLPELVWLLIVVGSPRLQRGDDDGRSPRKEGPAATEQAAS
jgi:membrane protease YdiL (CAAX protease family)